MYLCEYLDYKYVSLSEHGHKHRDSQFAIQIMEDRLKDVNQFRKALCVRHSEKRSESQSAMKLSVSKATLLYKYTVKVPSIN